MAGKVGHLPRSAGSLNGRLHARNIPARVAETSIAESAHERDGLTSRRSWRAATPPALGDVNGGSMDGYYAWMIVATALVLMMTTPALALFYGGMTRSKSVLNMMMMSFAALPVVGLIFVRWGWSEGWGGTNGAGNGNGDLIADPFTLFGLKNVPSSTFIAVLFQLTFAVITAALISGSIADRVKISSWMVFIAIWVTLVYFPIAHNVWGGGWFYSKFPNLDYAGGTVVHINAGVAGGVLALIIGPRIGFKKDPMKPHNLTLTMIGAGLLWFGWYGFNVGSIVFSEAGYAAYGKAAGCKAADTAC